MRSFFVWCCLFIFCLSTAQAAEIIIQNQGIYEVEVKRDMVINKYDLLELKKYRLIERTDYIPATSGTHFGFEFFVEGERDIYLEITTSAFLKKSSDKYEQVLLSKIPLNLSPGGKQYIGWHLEDKDEKYSEWQFKFSYPYTKFCSFKVVDPEKFQSRKDLKVEAKIEDVTGRILNRYLVRDGVYSQLTSAKERAAELKEMGYSPFIFVRDYGEHVFFYHVFVGVYGAKDEAEKKCASFAEKCNSKAMLEYVSIPLF